MEHTEHPMERNIYQQTEQEFFDFFEHAPIGLHWLAPDGIILRVNQAELDMLGYTREEYIGRNISEFYVDEEFVEDVLQKLQEGKSVNNHEGQMICKDGSIIDTSLSSNVYRRNGEFIHTRCFTRDISDNKQWEQKLKESEERYKTLVNNFPKGAVGLFDEDLKYTAVGGELLNQVGVTSEERIGNKITDLYPEQIIKKVKPYFEDVFKGKANSFEAEFHNRHLFGQTLPITNHQGQVISGMLVVQDITERWQMEQEVRESEAKFRMMAENLNEVIWIGSEDGKEFIYINPAFEKVWGISRKKLFEDPLYFLNLIHPEDRERIRKRYTSFSIDKFNDEYRITRPDGEVRWLHSRGNKVFNKEANITRIIGVAEDITQRKRAELQLRNSRNRLRTALDIETVGVLFWGKEGEDLIVTEANNAFVRMSGFSHEEVLGKSWRDFTAEEFYSVSENAIKDVISTGSTEPYEKKYIRKDGSRWWGLFAPRKIDDNEAVEFVLDITDRKEAQQKIEQINETLEERVKKRTKKLRSYQEQLRSLASQLNKAEEQERQRLATELHDHLGQMLAVAKFKIEGLQNELSGQGSTDLEELKEVVNDALAYSQNLMVELKPPPVLNKEDVTEVLDWTVKKMRKQGLDIQVEDDGQIKPVDKEIRSVLHQSVREVLQNVSKHAGTKKVRMQIMRNYAQVKVVIEDKGKGFNQKNTPPVPTEGKRFGLFNIKERMKWHGGTFELYSEPGMGTKVILQAPLKEEVREPKSTSPDAGFPMFPDKMHEQAGQAKRYKIILVDDHTMMRTGLRQIIDKQDFIQIVGEASQGREAVELARETKPDIIIMDVNMPVMDGIQATRIIKKEMPNVRIIGLSLHESPEVINNMKSAGASAYLTKNEAFESLTTTIQKEISGMISY